MCARRKLLRVMAQPQLCGTGGGGHWRKAVHYFCGPRGAAPVRNGLAATSNQQATQARCTDAQRGVQGGADACDASCMWVRGGERECSEAPVGNRNDQSVQWHSPFHLTEYLIISGANTAPNRNRARMPPLCLYIDYTREECTTAHFHFLGHI